MELKKYIRRGILEESTGYSTVLMYSDHIAPKNLLVLLEGKARRKMHLTGKRYLHENYYPVSIIGLEDLLMNSSHRGGAGVYPGSHYVIWNAEDFLQAVSTYPELARRAIFELSRRIRIYDDKSRVTPLDLKMEEDLTIGPPEEELTDTLYQISFSEEDEIPPHLIEKLKKKVLAGENLITQGDTKTDLYIIIDGSFSVYHNDKKFDTLGPQDFAGEMAQFDGMPRSATVTANTNSEVLSFSKENFHLLFQFHSKWSFKILRTLANRLEQRKKEM